MALEKENTIQKKYYSVKEVCGIFNEKPYTIRLWCAKFGIYKSINLKNKRFDRSQVMAIGVIHFLMRERLLYLRGIKKALDDLEKDKDKLTEVHQKVTEKLEFFFVS